MLSLSLKHTLNFTGRLVFYRKQSKVSIHLMGKKHIYPFKVLGNFHAALSKNVSMLANYFESSQRSI